MPSPNRDRVIRKSGEVTDWYVRFVLGNRAAILNDSVLSPPPPAGFIFDEDFRSPPSLNLTTVLAGDHGIYARDSTEPGNSGSQVTQSGNNPTGYYTRGLTGTPSGWYRLRLRVWGLFPLAKFYGLGTGYVTRLGTILPPDFPDYPPPDLTVYQKNPMLVYEWTDLGLGGSSLITTPDFAAFGGIPLNATDLASGSGSDSLELMTIDRLITAAVQLAPSTGFPNGAEYANIKEHRPYGTNERAGNVLETINRNAAGQPTGRESRFLHWHPFRPNGDFFNPPNPVTVAGVSPANGGTHLMDPSQSEAFFFRRCALGVHVLPLQSIPNYEPPTMI